VVGQKKKDCKVKTVRANARDKREAKKSWPRRVNFSVIQRKEKDEGAKGARGREGGLFRKWGGVDKVEARKARPPSFDPPAESETRRIQKGGPACLKTSTVWKWLSGQIKGDTHPEGAKNREKEKQKGTREVRLKKRGFLHAPKTQLIAGTTEKGGKFEGKAPPEEWRMKAINVRPKDVLKGLTPQGRTHSRKNR